MKRDFDLVRKLLLFYEEMDESKTNKPPELDGYSENDILFHMILLADAGYIFWEGAYSTTNPNRIVQVRIVFSLSWQGFEFLDSIRSDSKWNDVKKAIKDAGESISVSTLSAIAKKFAFDQLGLT